LTNEIASTQNKNEKSHHTTTKLPVPRENKIIPGLPWLGHLVKVAFLWRTFLFAFSTSSVIVAKNQPTFLVLAPQWNKLAGSTRRLGRTKTQMLLGFGTGLVSPVPLWATSRRQDDLVSILLLPLAPTKTFQNNPHQLLLEASNCGERGNSVQE
jgi:hypothetical protein